MQGLTKWIRFAGQYRPHPPNVTAGKVIVNDYQVRKGMDPGSDEFSLKPISDGHKDKETNDPNHKDPKQNDQNNVTKKC